MMVEQVTGTLTGLDTVPLCAGATASAGRGDERGSMDKQAMGPRRVGAAVTKPHRSRGTAMVAGPALSVPGACLHELVAVQIEARRDEVAVVCGEDILTFGELDERAARLTGRLFDGGVDRGDVVALFVERSLDMVVALLAIARSGAAYLPLDPRYPAERLGFILEDSGARLLVAQRHLLGGLPDSLPPVIGVNDSVTGNPAGRLAPILGPDDLAYLMYTSGSTGRPKGVEVRYGGVINFLASMAREPGVAPRDRVLAITTYAFDISVLELWLPLVAGARMVLATHEVATDGRMLGRLVADSDISLMQATPTTWQMLIDAGWRGKADLVAVSGGETLPTTLAEQLLVRCAALWNAYGPTETTVWSTLGRVERGAPLTIGRPIANTTITIVDTERRVVANGASGEILIGGQGVARGYHNRPELTAERFPGIGPDRVYATGDLGRLRPDGSLEHLGRIDDQIKVRGFRIEPAEIEAALVAHPDVAAAAVVAREVAPSDVRLIAYVVPRGSHPPTAADLRSLLRRRLPEQMVPARYVTMEAFPVTPNGKLDRRALPPPPPDTDPRPLRAAAAQTPVQEHLLHLWGRLLDLENVGVDEDFFDLGGHSLLAVRMLGEVEREFAVEVHAAAFYSRGRTVAGLAELITGHSRGDHDGLVVTIQNQGSRPPLFFVYPSESSMLSVRHFTGPLGGDQPVVGLLPVRTRGRFDPSRGVEELSAHLARMLRSVQPAGPYCLAGYSFGGLLAYEVARVLIDAGEEVTWLGILDAATPKAGLRYYRWRERLGRTVRRGPPGAARKTRAVWRRQSRALLVNLRLRRPHVDDDYDWQGAARLARRYDCRGHVAPLVVFLTRDQAAATSSAALGWEEFHAGSLAAHVVPGNHLSMVAEPNVGVLARLFADSLRAAQDVPAAVEL